MVKSKSYKVEKFTKYYRKGYRVDDIINEKYEPKILYWFIENFSYESDSISSLKFMMSTSIKIFEFNSRFSDNSSISSIRMDTYA